MGVIVHRLDGIDVRHQLRINILRMYGHSNEAKHEPDADALSQESSTFGATIQVRTSVRDQVPSLS
jgi:hypothetical protein